MITMVNIQRDGIKALDEATLKRMKMNKLEKLAIQRMTTINMLWSKLKAISLSVLGPIVEDLSNIIDKIIILENDTIQLTSVAKAGFTTVAIAIGVEKMAKGALDASAAIGAKPWKRERKPHL